MIQLYAVSICNKVVGEENVWGKLFLFYFDLKTK